MIVIDAIYKLNVDVPFEFSLIEVLAYKLTYRDISNSFYVWYLTLHAVLHRTQSGWSVSEAFVFR